MSSSLLSRLQKKPEKCNNLYVGENIPQKKLLKAIKAYAQDILPEDVIALFDDTVFGSATDGFLLTSNGILESYNKSAINFNTINSFHIQDNKIVINNDLEFKPVLINQIDLAWLSQQVRDYIYEVNGYTVKDVKTIFEESDLMMNNKVYVKITIPAIFSEYFILLNNHMPDFNTFIKTEDIIALISSNPINASSAVDAEEVLFITDKYIFFKKSMEFPHIFALDSIASCTYSDGKCSLKLMDGTNFLMTTIIDQDVFSLFITCVKEYVDNHSSKNLETDCKYFENIFFPPADKPTLRSRLVTGTTDMVSNNPLFNVISLLNGKSIVIVAFLRDNAPEKLLTLLGKLPGVGFAAGIAGLALGRALNWLNSQLMKYGEAYMMEQLVKNFKKRGISTAQLRNEINSNVYTILGDTIVDDSLELLEKYYPLTEAEQLTVDQVSEAESQAEDAGDESHVCKECGASVKPEAKFCANCGTKIVKEYKCIKCGYAQPEPMKFCPECGEKNMQ